MLHHGFARGRVALERVLVALLIAVSTAPLVAAEPGTEASPASATAESVHDAPAGTSAGTQGASQSSTTTPTQSGELGDLQVNGKSFAGVMAVASQLKNDLSKATAITASNGVDEIYLKDDQGRLYIAYGYYGGLERNVRVGQRGTLGDRILEVVAVDDEINTASEGVFSGVDDTWKLVRPLIDDLGKTGLAVAGLGAAYVGYQTLAATGTGVGLAAVAPAMAAAALTGAQLAAVGLTASALYFMARKVYLAYARRNPATIAQVTGETAAQIDHGTTITARNSRDRTAGEAVTELIRRTGPNGASLSEDEGPGFQNLEHVQQ